MLLSSDFANEGMTLMPLELPVPLVLRFLRALKCNRNVAKPMMTQMFTMLEPKTLPTEIGAPSALLVTDAITATVNSGSDVEKAIRLKPTAVLPSRVIIETLTALPIVRLLAQLRATKDTAMIMMSSANWVNTMSAVVVLFPMLKFFLCGQVFLLNRNNKSYHTKKVRELETFHIPPFSHISFLSLIYVKAPFSVHSHKIGDAANGARRKNQHTHQL